MFLSPEGEGTPPTLPQSCPTPLGLFWPVLPQPLLLQALTFGPAPLRKVAGNSSHPHSSCAIPPIPPLMTWVGSGDRRSGTEPQRRPEREVTVYAAPGLGIPVGLLAFFLSRLFLFPFLFLGRAQASCFQNIRLFFGRLTHALMRFRLRVRRFFQVRR